ncbi:MAG: PorT family protein [Bacteroidales bacterium]|nr:PorT family protein [Bacteroidales bacterium]
MKKISVICLIFSLLVTLPVLPQGKHRQGPVMVRTGLKAGANITAFEGGREFIDRIQNALNYQAGLVVQLNLNNFISFQPELLFITKGAELSNDGSSAVVNLYNSTIGSSNPIPNKITLQTAYIEIPLNLQLGIRLGQTGRVFILGGPYLSYLVSDKSTDCSEFYKAYKDIVDEYGKTGYKGVLHQFDYGVGIGAGIESGSLQLTAKYDFGYSEFKERVSRLTDRDINIFSGLKNRNMSLSLAWFF